MSTALALLAEAAQVGLTEPPARVESVRELSAKLAALMDWVPTVSTEGLEGRLPKLRDEVANVRAQLREITEKVQQANEFVRYASAYSA